MDNLTHTFIGWTLARAGFDRFGPWATPVLLVAANLPDAEVPLLFGDKAMYLAYHRGVSHSFLGFVLEALVVSLVVCGIAWVRRKREPESPPPKFLAVMFVALVGLLSHLLLDFLNTYGVRPLLPFDGRWFYGDMLFIADPWSWLILGAGLLIGTRAGGVVLKIIGTILVLGAFSVMAYGFRNDVVSQHVFFAWIGLAVLALVVNFWPPRGITPSRAAWSGLSAWTLYLLMAFFASRTATARAMEVYLLNAAPPQPIITSSASSAPAAPWRHTVVLQTENELFVYAVDEISGTVEYKTHLRRNLDCAASPALQNTREYKAWQSFARHPCCECSDGIITLFDGRYRGFGGADWTAFHLPQPGERPN